jgi:hypothetical protein
MSDTKGEQHTFTLPERLDLFFVFVYFSAIWRLSPLPVTGLPMLSTHGF